MRPRSIVFDLFGDYLRYRGGEARLRALVTLLEVFDVGESTARVALARLRRDGWFDTRAVGRETIYALSAKSWQLLDEGRDRIFSRDQQPWDGAWRMAIYEVPETERALREEVRKELVWLGFGPLATSTWITPRDRLTAVAERFGNTPGLRLDLLTCRSAGERDDRAMAARCWDLTGLNRDYAQFVAQYGRLLPTIRAGKLTGPRALVTRTELVHDYRRFPFRDPDLPAELLPAGWRGADAHALFNTAHDLLRPAAEAVVDGLLAEQPAAANE